MTRLLVAFAFFFFIVGATGCGQSGPLYIPGNPSTIQNPPPPDENAEEKEEEEDKDKN